MSEEPAGRKPSDLLSTDALSAAFQAQSALLEKFISMARSPDEPEVIKTMLRKTIEISIELTGAELAVSFYSTVKEQWSTVYWPVVKPPPS